MRDEVRPRPALAFGGMDAPRRRDVTTLDGRTLSVLEYGAPDGPVVVSHHGTPGSGAFFRAEREGADARGLRLVAYDRPGYGGSTPQTGRTVADAASARQYATRRSRPSSCSATTPSRASI